MNRRSFIALASGLLIPYEPKTIYSFASFDEERRVYTNQLGLFGRCIGTTQIIERVKYHFKDIEQYLVDYTLTQMVGRDELARSFIHMPPDGESLNLTIETSQGGPRRFKPLIYEQEIKAS